MDKLFRWQCTSVLSRRSRNENLYYRWCIDLSIGTSGEELFTDGKLPLYHPYRRYRWTRFLRPTSRPWNNANYLSHQRILHIHRWCIHFSIGTDEQPRFTDGKLPLPSVPRYQWTKFLTATSSPWTKANYLFHQATLDIHRWCIHFSIGTDEQPRFTDGKLPLPSVPSVPMDKVFEGYLMLLD